MADYQTGQVLAGALSRAMSDVLSGLTTGELTAFDIVQRLGRGKREERRLEIEEERLKRPQRFVSEGKIITAPWEGDPTVQAARTPEEVADIDYARQYWERISPEGKPASITDRIKYYSDPRVRRAYGIGTDPLSALEKILDPGTSAADKEQRLLLQGEHTRLTSYLNTLLKAVDLGYEVRDSTGKPIDVEKKIQEVRARMEQIQAALAALGGYAGPTTPTVAPEEKRTPTWLETLFGLSPPAEMTELFIAPFETAPTTTPKVQPARKKGRVTVMKNGLTQEQNVALLMQNGYSREEADAEIAKLQKAGEL